MTNVMADSGIENLNADDKNIINRKTDVNRLVPFKYKRAWDKYLAGCSLMLQDAGKARFARAFLL